MVGCRDILPSNLTHAGYYLEHLGFVGVKELLAISDVKITYVKRETSSSPEMQWFSVVNKNIENNDCHNNEM